MHIFHYNDEEKDLHSYLAARGHSNVVLPANVDPFPVAAETSFDAAFIGLHPHGMELIQTLKQSNPDCMVTMITSDQKTRPAVESMKRGAFDYLLSPLDFTEVERTYILLEREYQAVADRRRLQEQLAAAYDASRLVGASQAIQKLRRLITRVARTRAPILLLGETGTGKELVAQLIHETSSRRDKALVSINCNAIPASLIESELFGYLKGAFTGADDNRDGLLAQADGGVCFLDEVQDLDLVMQGKLLRVLQHGEILPIGARTVRRLDVRFIAATNADLEELVRQRRFREDLYYRLNVVPIVIPPLRDRAEDISLLARHFIDTFCQRELREPLKVAPEVWRWLSTRAWHGNVRELENLCLRVVALSERDTFDAETLAMVGALGAEQLGRASAADSNATSLRQSTDQASRHSIEQALTDYSGNVSRAARALGVSRTTFYAKARRLDIRLPRERMRPR